jgi:WD40 repeat protein
VEASTIQLWSVPDGQRLGSALPHHYPLVVTFSPDSKVLVSCSLGLLRRWPVLPAQQPQATLVHSHKVLQLAFGPDGRTFATGTWGRAAHLLSLTPADGDRCAILTPRAPPLLQGSEVRCLAFSRDGQALFTGGGREARAWSAVTGQSLGPPLKLAGRGNLVRLLADADAQTVWTVDALSNGTVDVQRWSVPNGAPLGTAIRFQGSGKAVARSPDGRLFLTGQRNGGGAQLWDADSGQPLGPALAPEEKNYLPGVAFHPDGEVAATGAFRMVRLWDVASRQPIGAPLAHPNNVNALYFSPDGKVLLAQGNHEVRLWSADTGQPIGTPLLDRGGLILYRDMSPDSKLVLTSGADAAQLWSTVTSHPIGPPLRHGGLVQAGAFSPDGKLLASGGEDFTVCLRPAPTPLEGSPEQVLLWAEVLTGMWLDGHSHLMVQDGDAWMARRRQLDAQDDLPAELRPQGRIVHE